jgi:hypothetical protein
MGASAMTQKPTDNMNLIEAPSEFRSNLALCGAEPRRYP